jgi:hypothetical protein
VTGDNAAVVDVARDGSTHVRELSFCGKVEAAVIAVQSHGVPVRVDAARFAAWAGNHRHAPVSHDTCLPRRIADARHITMVIDREWQK